MIRHWRSRRVFAILAAAVAMTAAGCATYQDNVNQARHLLESGDPMAAAHDLKKLAQQRGNDQLVYLFDYATCLQVEGRYKASNRYFDRADQLADVKDYLSVSREAGSLLFAQEMVQYKGEDYENLLVNLMEALNYLMLGDHDDARVEVRAMNDKLDYYRLKENRSYDQNTMALYLGGMMWEDDKNYDSAYIEYSKAYKLNPGVPSLQTALVRTAYLDQRHSKFRKWSKKFGIPFDKKWTDPNYGELILIYEQGWAPRKYPRPEAPELPELFPRPSETVSAEMNIAGMPAVQTQEVYSVQRAAIKTLDDEYNTLVAKQVAGYVAKQVVADQVAQKNQALGAILDIAMQASDRADLRQWSTLPQSFQVARVYLKTGNYNVSVQGLNSAGLPSVDRRAAQSFTIQPQKKTFFIWRSFH